MGLYDILFKKAGAFDESFFIKSENYRKCFTDGLLITGNYATLELVKVFLQRYNCAVFSAKV